MPEGLLEMLRRPGAHATQDSPDSRSTRHRDASRSSRRPPRDGRLAKLPKFGPKTAAKILEGIADRARTRIAALYHHALRRSAARCSRRCASHPDVDARGARGRHPPPAPRSRRASTSSPRARRDPVAVAQSFTRIAGVKSARGDEALGRRFDFVDGAQLELHCVDAGAVRRRALAGDGKRRARRRGRCTRWKRTASTVDDDRLARCKRRRRFRRPTSARSIAAPVSRSSSRSCAKDSARSTRPSATRCRRLSTLADIRGVLHCHSHYSDGKASIAEMAQRRAGARLELHRHHRSLAGGVLRRRTVARSACAPQHDEIDELNATLDGFRVLKGIEADILADGQLDYGDELLDEFDFVVGSIHSRFSMDRRDDDRARSSRARRSASHDPRPPHGTAAALARAICARRRGRARESRRTSASPSSSTPTRIVSISTGGILQRAKALGVTIEIGPDAHSARGLDNMEIGVGIARKGWLERADVLNARSADDVLAFARARRRP